MAMCAQRNRSLVPISVHTRSQIPFHAVEWNLRTRLPPLSCRPEQPLQAVAVCYIPSAQLPREAPKRDREMSADCACQCKIGPSILNADFSELAAESQRVVTGTGADYLHIDVMDGYARAPSGALTHRGCGYTAWCFLFHCSHFVPPITFGATMVKCLRKKMPDTFFGQPTPSLQTPQLPQLPCRHPLVATCCRLLANHELMLIHTCTQITTRLSVMSRPG